MSFGEKQPIQIICGLGNPGSEYEKTRHNVGFMIIDRLLTTFKSTFERKHECAGESWRGRFRGRNLLLQKPLTFMNESGESIAPLMRRSSLTPANLLLVYDDMDLPLGRIRIRSKGSAGGHHGVESVIEKLGSDQFSRIRVGIGERDGKPGRDHVLSEFTTAENRLLEDVLKAAVEAVMLILRQGVKAAMNKFNGHDLASACDQNSQVAQDTEMITS